MHDSGGCTTTDQVKNGDTWLAQQVPQILNSAAYQNNGALFITFDESEGGDFPIGMIALSPLAKPGYSNTLPYSHSSTLRTMQEIFGVGPCLGAAARTLDLGDLFNNVTLNTAVCPTAPATLNLTTTGAGQVHVTPPDGDFTATSQSYSFGSTVQLMAEPSPGNVFVGWTLDGMFQGWAPAPDLTMDTDHALVAHFAPITTFADTASDRADYDAIVALATRGTILGFNATTYGPDQGVQRAQMAALIARATPNGPGRASTILAQPDCTSAGTWDCDDWGTSPFVDRNGLVASLWRDVVTLWHYGVARGVDATHYGPNSPVTYAETVAFITRAMERKNYWVAQSTGPVPPGIPAVFNSEGRTFTFYAGSPPTLPPGKGWNDAATRGWFAQALWVALNSYWAPEGLLPDGHAAGGNLP